ncbi:MAG: CoA transferase [Burkholderiales bacterium]|nr:CoA transferase [Burkholderiales bacterium]
MNESDRADTAVSGPLRGVRILEFAGLGPVPFAGMLLSDMGADVVRIERGDIGSLDPLDVTARGRRFVAVDLKQPKGVEQARRLAQCSDVLLEGFRPGVMERLGLGPEPLRAINRRLVYARMTGWGQNGALAQAVGHDINYIAIAGALGAIGLADRPVPPLNLVGDYGGGALYLVVGVLAALLEARRSGEGQVVDCAMVDGVASLLSLFQGWLNAQQWQDKREANLLDGAAPFYTTYACRDGRHIAVGAIEPRFYARLCELTGFSDPESDDQHDRGRWPWRREALARIFASRTRDDWCRLLEGTEACVSPVLDLAEAPAHPHLADRATFVSVDGRLQAAPAPRFLRTPSAVQGPPPSSPVPVSAVIRDWSI